MKNLSFKEKECGVDAGYDKDLLRKRLFNFMGNKNYSQKEIVRKTGLTEKAVKNILFKRNFSQRRNIKNKNQEIIEKLFSIKVEPKKIKLNSAKKLKSDSLIKKSIKVCSKNNLVFFNGKQITLMELEFKTIEILYIWAGIYLTREEIMDYVYFEHYEPAFSPVIRVLIRFIRKKIPEIKIKSKMGRNGGYMMEIEDRR